MFVSLNDETAHSVDPRYAFKSNMDPLTSLGLAHLQPDWCPMTICTFSNTVIVFAVSQENIYIKI
jgi:hypothetical protein